MIGCGVKYIIAPERLGGRRTLSAFNDYLMF